MGMGQIEKRAKGYKMSGKACQTTGSFAWSGPQRGTQADRKDPIKNAYSLHRVEEPDPANRILGNLARGHALSQGRNYITMADMPLLANVALSTAPIYRVAVFDLLLKKNGRLETSDIMDGLRVSHHTAHRVMTELFALGLVDRQKEGYYDNSKMQIELKKKSIFGALEGIFDISGKGFS